MASLTVRLRVAFVNQHVQQRFIEAVERLATVAESQPWNTELCEAVDELADVAESLTAVKADGPTKHENDSSRGG